MYLKSLIVFYLLKFSISCFTVRIISEQYSQMLCCHGNFVVNVLRKL